MSILLPSQSADDWQRFLADPGKQWQRGYSARTLAHSWHDASGFPREVRAALIEQFPDIEMLLGIPEHKVAMPGRGYASQTDLWVLASASGELISIAVEGKVSEPFGPSIDEWLDGASANKRARLESILSMLGCGQAIPGSIRYQLLHRAASAVLEAKRFSARHAVLLVHSFSRTSEWFDDFKAFGTLLGVDVCAGTLTPVSDCKGVKFSMGWVCGDENYLSR